MKRSHEICQELKKLQITSKRSKEDLLQGIQEAREQKERDIDQYFHEPFPLKGYNPDKLLAQMEERMIDTTSKGKGSVWVYSCGGVGHFINIPTFVFANDEWFTLIEEWSVAIQRQNIPALLRDEVIQKHNTYILDIVIPLLLSIWNGAHPYFPAHHERTNMMGILKIDISEK